MADPITRSASGLDLSDRFVASTAVAASPATGAAVAVANATWNPPDFPSVQSGVFVEGAVNFTGGTSGTSATLTIRRGSVAGTVVTGATAQLSTVVTGAANSLAVQGFDTLAVVPGQVYALCLSVTGASAASNVTQASLAALVV